MSNNLKVALLQKNILKAKEKPTNEKKNMKIKKLINSNKEVAKEINKLVNPKKGQIYVHINNNDYSFYQFNGEEWDEIV